MLTKRKKQALIKKHQAHATDTGSSALQIAMLTKRIEELTAHLKKHKKDQHSRRGLIGIVAQRRRHLQYLAKKDSAAHAKITKELKLKA